MGLFLITLIASIVGAFALIQMSRYFADRDKKGYAYIKRNICDD